MEKLIRSKIAEIEKTYPIQVMEKHLLLQLQRNIDAQDGIDENQFCRQFDSEVIDERKPPEDRIRTVRELFIEQIRIVKSLESDYALSFQHCKDSMQKYHDMLGTLESTTNEKTKLVEVNTKMQEICRLLQKQSKDIAEEKEKMSEMEKNRMEELTAKFNATLIDINAKLTEQQELQKQQEVENDELREKIKQFDEHHALRDSHFSTQIKAKSLEVQLAETKHQQQVQLLKQEKHKNDALRHHINQLTATELELKTQLNLYSEKFEHFQDALNKSNSMFVQFEAKMGVMSSTIEKLEKESSKLKKKCSSLDCELIMLIDERQKTWQELNDLKLEKDRLERHCRQLQLKRSGGDAEQPETNAPESTRSRNLNAKKGYLESLRAEKARLEKQRQKLMIKREELLRQKDKKSGDDVAAEATPAQTREETTA